LQKNLVQVKTFANAHLLSQCVSFPQSNVTTGTSSMLKC